MRGKSLTPEDIAALMGDDLQENNGLKPGVHFSESLTHETPKFDYTEVYRSYVLPNIKPKKAVTESWYPEPVSAPTPKPIPAPKPIPVLKVSPKPVFGETERKLEL